MGKSKLYTRTGDRGNTSLVGGTRTSKDNPRIEAYGTVDELNSWLGLLLAQPQLAIDQRQLLIAIQSRLFDIGAYLACDPAAGFHLPAGVTADDIAAVESAIDALDAALPKLTSFVLPSGSQTAAVAHVARTVARRAERRIVTLAAGSPVSPEVLQYINRLSDYLFALARFSNINQGVAEIFWQKNC